MIFFSMKMSTNEFSRRVAFIYQPQPCLTEQKSLSVDLYLGALHLKFSKATGLWTAMETCVYIGDSMGEKGAQRTTIWVQFLHQEERLSKYGSNLGST